MWRRLNDASTMMNNTTNFTLGSHLLSWLVTLAGILWLVHGYTSEADYGDVDLDRYGQDVPPCSDDQHTWRVWCSGYEPGDYYYRCSRCGWVALPGEVEQ